MSAGSWLLLAVLVLACLHASQVCACFAVVVGREATADGSVLLGHNEENEGQRVLNFRRVPAAEHAPGARVRLRRGGTLEQAPRTAGFLWSQNPGLESSDSYLNDFGVAVVSDGCTSREDGYETLVARGDIRSGGVGVMLRRLVAERAKTAREGVELAGRLVEEFGYAGSGRTYVIADPREAWLVAVVRGRRWAARRVPDDSAAVVPNVFTLDEVGPGDPRNFLGSADLVEYAARRGWCDPADGRPFSFRRAYQAPERNAPDPRQWWGQQLVCAQAAPRGAGGADLPAAEDFASVSGPLPCFVKPGRKLSVADLAAILRNAEGPRALFHPATQEMAVFQLRSGPPAEVGCVYWRTTGRPDCTGLTPWYAGITEAPPEYAARDFRGLDDLGDRPDGTWLDRHFNPPARTFAPDPGFVWWEFRALQDAVDEGYAARIGPVRRSWAAFEAALFGAQAGFEKRVLELWQTDRAAARRELTRYSARQAAAAREEAARLAERVRVPSESSRRAPFSTPRVRIASTQRPRAQPGGSSP